MVFQIVHKNKCLALTTNLAPDQAFFTIFADGAELSVEIDREQARQLASRLNEWAGAGE